MAATTGGNMALATRRAGGVQNGSAARNAWVRIISRLTDTAKIATPSQNEANHAADTDANTPTAIASVPSPPTLNRVGPSARRYTAARSIKLRMV
ncbi:MAG TPA: hypothetical protein DCE44_24935 [Verrucomicrobiales bacterium]|nr:hypothetical protein [Verrucomicrobiales bacterium]